MTRAPKAVTRHFARAFVVACAAFAVFASPASAATPCWKTLLNDWYDGHIDHVYPIPCYHAAIKHLPTDVEVYSSARDDINNALQQAIAFKNNKPIVTTNSSGATTTIAAVGPTGPTTTPPKKKRNPFSSALRDITPGGADSFPLPLLILGMLAILLVLAGVGGIAWRRYQARGGDGGGGDSPTQIT